MSGHPSPERVADRIWLVRAPLEPTGSVCLYVLRGARLAVIDTGFSHHPTDALAPALSSLGLSLDDVDVILNTHGHPDHLGGNAALKAASHAAIHLHSADVPLAAGPDAHIHAQTDFIDTLRALGWTDQVAAREAFLRQRIGRDVGVDRVLEDGDVVDLGADLRLRVVHMPGHTPGSVAFLSERDRLAFTGDAVQAWGGRSGALPLYVDPTRYAASIERLRDLHLRTLCLGHPFRWSRDLVTPSPVREDDAVRQTLEDSLTFVHAAEQAIAAVTPGDEEPAAREAFVRHALEALRGPFAFPPGPHRFAVGAAVALLAHRAQRPHSPTHTVPEKESCA